MRGFIDQTNQLSCATTDLHSSTEIPRSPIDMKNNYNPKKSVFIIQVEVLSMFIDGLIDGQSKASFTDKLIKFLHIM